MAPPSAKQLAQRRKFAAAARRYGGRVPKGTRLGRASASRKSASRSRKRTPKPRARKSVSRPRRATSRSRKSASRARGRSKAVLFGEARLPSRTIDYISVPRPSTLKGIGRRTVRR
jgi:hypothetical protein